MPLEDLDSPEAVEAFKSQNAGGALICFSATWCGPCKASKPQLEALAASYDADGGAVAVGIAYEHNLGDDVERRLMLGRRHAEDDGGPHEGERHCAPSAAHYSLPYKGERPAQPFI